MSFVFISLAVSVLSGDIYAVLQNVFRLPSSSVTVMKQSTLQALPMLHLGALPGSHTDQPDPAGEIIEK